MSSCLLFTLILAYTSYCIVAIDDIPSHYISSKDKKTLFCNACGILASVVNDTLYDDSVEFETLVGYRLGSDGKKIRKNNAFLKLYLSLEDVCDNWKDKYRTAKRKNGYLYLIEDSAVRDMEKIEKERKRKLEKEASDRLRKQWDNEWMLERLADELRWNQTHDENGNLIETNDTNDSNITDNMDNSDDNQNNTETETETDIADGDKSEKEEEKEEEEPEKKYFYEKKPKLLKKKSKIHKMIKDICYFLDEKLDEWLHQQEKIISKKLKQGGVITDYLDPQSFCLEDGLCHPKFFNIYPKIYKFKKELNLPKKPKRPQPQPEPMEEEIEYDEEMEDDDDDDNDGDNNDNNENNDIDNNDQQKPKTDL